MKPTYNLQQIVHIVQEWFREVFFEFQFWVSAEIMKIKKHKSRYYLDLIQYNDAGDVLAKARGIIRDEQVISDFVHDTQLSLDDLVGKTLMMSAKCNFHHQWWFSLTIDQISSEFTLWEAAKQQQHIRNTLQQLWIYKHNKQTILGLAPMRIAAISSATSEWLKDFLSVIQESDFGIKVDMYQSAVHGNIAKQQVTQALDKIVKSEVPYTAVCLMRWWGGGDGIVRQNDLEIAKKVCELKVPMILAIGHTSDKSILDEIVYHSCKTPTDAAYVLVSTLAQRHTQITDTYQHISDISHSKLSLIQEATQRYYDDICTLSINQHIKIQKNITSRYDSISQFGPAAVLSKWYALLISLELDIIDTKSISKIKTDDEFVVKTATKNITVKAI